MSNSIFKFNKNIGIIIVTITSIISVLIAVFFNFLVFLFKTMVAKYCIKFITFELKILYILAPY